MRSDVSENAEKRNPLRLRSGLRLTRLRGNGVMIGYELRGPSPESSTLADVASASRQLAAAFMHLGTAIWFTWLGEARWTVPWLINFHGSA